MMWFFECDLITYGVFGYPLFLIFDWNDCQFGYLHCLSLQFQDAKNVSIHVQFVLLEPAMLQCHLCLINVCFYHASARSYFCPNDCAHLNWQEDQQSVLSLLVEFRDCGNVMQTWFFCSQEFLSGSSTPITFGNPRFGSYLNLCNESAGVDGSLCLDIPVTSEICENQPQVDSCIWLELHAK